jgi:signal transduction histidine kinase
MLRNTRLRVLAIAIPMLAASAAWISSSVSRMHDDAINDAFANAANIATLLASQASQSVQAIDLALDELTDRAAVQSMLTDGATNDDPQSNTAFNFLVRRLAYLPKAEVITLANRDGHAVASTRGWPAPNINISGNDPFDYLKSHSDRSLAISLSMPALVTGDQTVYFSRRIENRSGEFLGVAAIGVRPEYFLTLFDGSAPLKGAIVSLRRFDGKAIAHYPPEATTAPDVRVGSEWFELINHGGGTFRNVIEHQASARLQAVRPVGRYPLALSVGVRESDVLETSRGRAFVFALQAGLIAIAITAVVCILFIQFWKARSAGTKILRQASDLRTANGLFKRVLTNMEQGIAKFDSDRRIVFHNRRYAEMYGVPSEKMPVGTPITEIWEMRVQAGIFLKGDPDGYVKRHATRVESTSRASRSSIDHLEDGRYILISHQPLPDGSWITTHEDITQRQAATVAEHDELEALIRARTEEIQQKSDELEFALFQQKAINEQQRIFVSMASHEFRTPLAIIDSSAQKLLRRASQLQPMDIVERAQTIRRAVQRMTGLMESVLSAAKFEHAEIKLSPKDDDLFQVLCDCCYRHLEVSDRHRFQVDLDAVPRSVRIDAKAIDQVMTNLIANAIKFSPENSTINIKSEVVGDRIRIDIQDYGLGIDADDLPKMFTRYFRAKTSTGIAGTGIGLNVVKLIVEMHGGEVKVASVKGEGSIFSVYLPLAGSQRSSIGQNMNARELSAAA